LGQLSDFSSKFWDKIFELNLEQLVNKPTHINSNILDVVLTNFPISQPVVIEDHPQVLSFDHFIITFSVPKVVHTKVQQVCYVAYNYSKADWESIYNFCWITIFKNTVI